MDPWILGRRSFACGQDFNLWEIAAVRPSWGSPRIHVLLRRDGWLVNHKPTERLYAWQD